VKEEDVAVTGVVAMAVRNAMEDFAPGTLDHRQMTVLNRIIRNAILTALYAIENSDDPRCAAYVKFQQFTSPGDWERPELLESLARRRERHGTRPPGRQGRPVRRPGRPANRRWQLPRPRSVVVDENFLRRRRKFRNVVGPDRGP